MPIGPAGKERAMGRIDFGGRESRFRRQAADAGKSRFGRRAADGLMAINVLLLPDERALERARALNATLRASFAPGFAFDDTHEPHVTALQRYVGAADLGGVLGAIEGVVPDADLGELRLRATGLDGLEFGTPPGSLLAGIAIEPAATLRVLQGLLVEALARHSEAGGTPEAFYASGSEPQANAATVAYVEGYVPARTGERYRPHMTVGVATTEALEHLTAAFVPFELSVRAVAAYQLGDLGTARRALRVWPLRAQGPASR